MELLLQKRYCWINHHLMRYQNSRPHFGRIHHHYLKNWCLLSLRKNSLLCLAEAIVKLLSSFWSDALWSWSRLGRLLIETSGWETAKSRDQLLSVTPNGIWTKVLLGLFQLWMCQIDCTTWQKHVAKVMGIACCSQSYYTYIAKRKSKTKQNWKNILSLLDFVIPEN